MKLEVKRSILGFEETTAMEFSQVDNIFVKIESLDGAKFSFIMIESQKIRPGYDFGIHEGYMMDLDLNPKSNKEAYIILALDKEDINKSTLNFLAPILINWDNNTMVQVILDPNEYKDFSSQEYIGNYLQDEDKE